MIGKRKVSREVFARMLGVSTPTIQKWENGNAPSAMNERKLRDLAKQLADGKLPKGLADGKIPKGLEQRKRSSRSEKRDEIAATPTPFFYANDIKIERGEHDARISFSLVGARDIAVVDVMVPLAVLSRLA